MTYVHFCIYVCINIHYECTGIDENIYPHIYIYILYIHMTYVYICSIESYGVLPHSLQPGPAQEAAPGFVDHLSGCSCLALKLAHRRSLMGRRSSKTSHHFPGPLSHGWGRGRLVRRLGEQGWLCKLSIGYGVTESTASAYLNIEELQAHTHKA